MASGAEVPAAGFGPACLLVNLLFFSFSLFCYVQALYFYGKLTLLLMESFQICMHQQGG